MIKVGLVGYGYWGPNLARNFQNSASYELVWICDSNSETLHKANFQYPHISLEDNYEAALLKNNVDLIVIATPPETHFQLALKAIQFNCHVLIEKPMTLSKTHDDELLRAARNRNVKIFVDHTFLFTPAIEKMRELEIEKENISSFVATRVNLGIIQEKANVLWDLAIHDISILINLLNPKTIKLRCFGFQNPPSNVVSQAMIYMLIDNTFPAEIYVSWLSLIKKRSIEITSTNRMIIFDDLQPVEKVKIIEGGAKLDPFEKRIQYRLGDVWSPYVQNKEALSLELENICASILENEESISDGEFASKVDLVISACDSSMENNGVEITLELT